MNREAEALHTNQPGGAGKLHRPVKKIISAEPLSIGAYWGDVMKYKTLIWVFAKEDLKVLYAQTYFGLLWGIMRPMFTLLVFTMIFKNFLRVSTQSPYYLFAFTGIVAWNFFSQISATASSAVIQKRAIIHKMYFPKAILIFSKILVAGVEMGISLSVLIVLIIIEGVHVGLGVFTLPFFILLNIICAFAIAIWMNALNVRFRDLNQIIPAVIGIAIWVTPVFYPVAIIPQGYEVFVYANPMAGVIKGYRFALLGEGFPEWQYWISLSVTTVIALTGLWYFSRTEDKIVDYA